MHNLLKIIVGGLKPLTIFDVTKGKNDTQTKKQTTMNHQTKHYLVPSGISRTVTPTNRPTFNEWANFIHNQPDPADEHMTEDEFEQERERREEARENQNRHDL